MNGLGHTHIETNEIKKWYLPLLALGILLLEICFFTITVYVVKYAADANNSNNANTFNTNAASMNQATNYSTPRVMKPAANAPPAQNNDCGVGTQGTFSGGNFRSSPRHSVGEANIIAIVDPGATVKILAATTGEARVSTGNINWYRVKFQAGSCQFDQRNRSDVYNCDVGSLDTGFINADLISNCYR